MTKPLVFNYGHYEKLRDYANDLLLDNEKLMADNRKLRQEVMELKQLNDGYVKIIAKNQETNNKLMASVQKQTGGDYIKRADAIEAVKETKPIVRSTEHNWGKMIAEQHSKELVKALKALPSADAVQGWITDRKPTDDGTYLVTIADEGGDFVCELHYGEPLNPICKVNGPCWYDSDAEFGDCPYCDILAWQPLPTPYKGGDAE